VARPQHPHPGLAELNGFSTWTILTFLASLLQRSRPFEKCAELIWPAGGASDKKVRLHFCCTYCHHHRRPICVLNSTSLLPRYAPSRRLRLLDCIWSRLSWSRSTFSFSLPSRPAKISLTVHLYGLLVRATKKKSSQFMSFYFWFIDFLFRRQLHSIHGADGDPGVLFPQNCFFDITFVFGFVEWDAPKFSMAFTKLDDRVLAFYQVLLLGFCSFLPPSVLATARTRNHKTLGALGGIKIQGFPTNSQKERKMEDAGCSGLMVFSLLSFST